MFRCYWYCFRWIQNKIEQCALHKHTKLLVGLRKLVCAYVYSCVHYQRLPPFLRVLLLSTLICSTKNYENQKKSRNWDGGYQEFSTAAECVREIFPDSVIEAKRTDNYPIRVIITANVKGKNWEIWSGRQQDLFQKYASKRKQAMANIQANLIDLQESL